MFLIQKLTREQPTIFFNLTVQQSSKISFLLLRKQDWQRPASRTANVGYGMLLVEMRSIVCFFNIKNCNTKKVKNLKSLKPAFKLVTI
jgi:hypothetical protein